MRRLLGHLFGRLHLERLRNVVFYCLLVTAFTVTVTVASLGGGLYIIFPFVPALMIAGVMAIGAVLAGVITLPVSFIILYTLHLQVRVLDDLKTVVKYDHLTGVYTRQAFLSYVTDKWKQGGVLMMADADHFKSINDRFGHDVGDDVLRAIAATLENCVGRHGAVGRLGGEEFGIFLPCADLQSGESLAREIGATLREYAVPQLNAERNITVSIGVAPAVPGTSIAETLKLADSLLYWAKQNGRDRAVSPRSAIPDKGNGALPLGAVQMA